MVKGERLTDVPSGMKLSNTFELYNEEMSIGEEFRVCVHVSLSEYLSTTTGFRRSLKMSRESGNEAETLVSS